MNLVDSCGWLEYFAGSPIAHHYVDAIEAADALVVPSICIYEVARKLFQLEDTQSALEAVGVMMQSKIVPLDAAISLEAACLAHELKLPMADAVILATARKCGAMVLTQDAHFEGVAGVHFIHAKQH